MEPGQRIRSKAGRIKVADILSLLEFLDQSVIMYAAIIVSEGVGFFVSQHPLGDETLLCHLSRALQARLTVLCMITDSLGQLRNFVPRVHEAW